MTDLTTKLTAYGNLMDLVDYSVLKAISDDDATGRGSAIRHNAVQLEDHLDHDLAAAATTVFNIATHSVALLAEIFADLADRSTGSSVEDLISAFASTRGFDDE